MKNVRVGVTLQALMRSTRLDKKPILKLCGREMIAHQIDRLKMAKTPEVLILCTSTEIEDQVLVNIAKREGIEAFTGPKDDLLQRLLMVAEKYNLDYIIAAAGDNPLTDAEHIDILAEYIVKSELDYADGIGELPIGTFAKAVKTNALKKACEIKSVENTEAWMLWFTMTQGLFKTGKIKGRPWLTNTGIRLTVDTPKDFELMEKIFNKFYFPGKVFSLAEVLVYLKENPEIAGINKEITQLKIEHFTFGLKPEFERCIKKN